MGELYKDFLTHLTAVWRRRWIVLAVTAVVSLIGWAIVISIPNTYTASGQIFVDTRTLLRPLLSGLAVEPDMDRDLAVMTQTLLNRPNLEEVARRTDLDLTVKTPAEMDALVARLRDRTTVKSTKSNLFTITNENTDPKRASEIVQALISIFVESNLGNSRTDMASAFRFLDQQIQDYQRQLEEAEGRLAAFKQRHTDMLSGVGGYQARVETAKGAVSNLEVELKEALTERDILQRELAGTPPFLTQVARGPRGEMLTSPVALQIQQLENGLRQMMLTMTEQHPDVINMKKQIEDLRALQREQQARGETASAQAAGDGTPGIPNPAHSQFKMQLVQKETEIAKLQDRLARARDTVARLQQASSQAPQVEADLKRLNRDYDVIKSRYDELLARRESARMSRDREASGDKVQFRIIEPPQVPTKPSGPNRLLLLNIVLPFALITGIGVALVLSLISDAFSDARRLGEYFRLPVLGSVSDHHNGAPRGRAWANRVAFGGALAALLSVYGLLILIDKQAGLYDVTSAAMKSRSLGPVLSSLSETFSALFSSSGGRV